MLLKNSGMRHHVQLAYVAGLCSRNESCCHSEGRAGALQGRVSLHNFFSSSSLLLPVVTSVSPLLSSPLGHGVEERRLLWVVTQALLFLVFILIPLSPLPSVR